MKRSPLRIREEIERLQEELRVAEAKQAERLGRLALKAGIGDLRIADRMLVAALRELASRFYEGTDHKATDAAHPKTGASDE